MKKFMLLACMLPALLSAQSSWKYLHVSPAQPGQGEKIQLEYDLTENPLANSDAFDLVVVEFDGKEPVAIEVSQQNINNKIVASVPVSAEALVVYVGMDCGDKSDNNMGAGYFIYLNDRNGKPIPESKAAHALLYRNYGGYGKLDRKADFTLDLLNEAFALQPDLQYKPDYLSLYVSTYLGVNKNSDEAREEVLKRLEKAEQYEKADEVLLTSIMRLYSRLTPEKSKALKERITTDYPKGATARSERLVSIGTVPELDKQEALLEAFGNEFPPQTDGDRSMLSNAYTILAGKVADEKNWDKFHAIAEHISAGQRASIFNNLAWDLAEKGEDVDQANRMAAMATEWARMDMIAPSGVLPAFLTREQWQSRREGMYANYSDTYAYVLDKSGNPQAAADMQAKAIALMDEAPAEFCDRHITYLQHANAPNLRHQLESYILNGQANSNMKDLFKQLYQAEDRSEMGVASYLAQMEQVARAKKKQHLLQTMIDQPAPAFSLKNLKGETVTLGQMKGKVVILDFWATWCGPCKASFPGMQTTLDKYKDDQNVAFLFIDTWEKVDDKEQNATTFIQEKGYSFNVLMDNDNQVVSSFGVSGIPTKFILDKNGKIRFKSIGYSGNADELVDELSIMIDIAKGQP
ncbi:MAG: TlpA disulfide reductase family protein [Saprospiraceae bacterium]